MIWISSATEAWEPVVVVSHDTSSVTVRNRSGGSEYKIPGSLALFDSVTPQALEEDCENLINLESYNEGIILHHVRKRFTTDKIYTLVGNILVALNPYKSLNIYDNQVIDKMFEQVKNQVELTPHIYTTAALAVHNMKRDRKDQSVLISGESGAGKTEATKKILQFISTVSGSTASRVGRSIETQILDSNPILESFGNAKTIRNNNSSRFGKYMEVNFDKKNSIKGCNVTAYLLEKSRVVKQGPNERNYHIFYMFLSGASKDMKREFALKPADQFYYLTQSGCLEIDRRSDYKEFEEMMFAFDSLKVELTTLHQIFQCLAAILHLGNVIFAESKDVEGGSRMTNPADSRRIAGLLGVSEEGLERALCNKDTIINGEPLLIPLTPEKAIDQRDSLAKFVYGKVFDFIVQCVNTSLFRGKPGLSIGVLDIFGFEVFQHNSFEQLCINYCNERLQTFFNEIIFEGEMKMYSAEGLSIEDISYQDNMGCVRLIDLRGAGVFAYLDEEVTIPKGTDEKFVSKLNQIFDENPNTKSVFFLRNHKSPVMFTIRHFAGDVHYNAGNFLEKNRDALPESLMKLLQSSTISILHPQKLAADGSVITSPTPSGNKKNSKLTLAGKFKNDLDNLMTILRATIPHFVRCIKPNLEQIPTKFEAGLVLNQLKYSGLFEAIRIRKSGYEVRMTHEQFISRYKHCLTFPPPSAIDRKTMHKEYCEYLLGKMNTFVTEDPYFVERKKTLEKAAHALLKKSGGTAAAAATGNTSTGASLAEAVIGKTRVFLRRQLTKILFDEYRDSCAENVVFPIQKLIRGFLARCRFQKAMGVTKKESAERRKREGYERSLMAIEDRIASEQEKIWRSDKDLQKKLYDAKLKRMKEERQRIESKRLTAVIRIQAFLRGKLYGHQGRIYLCERLLEEALQSRDEELMQKALARPKQYQITSKLIQLYRKHIKNVILEIMNEKYVTTSLQEAIQIRSIPLLTAALQLVKENAMQYLPEVLPAKQLLQQLSNHRMVLHYLEDELSKCTTMSLLMEKYDIIQYLIQQAIQYPDLQGERMIQEATNRLQKITNCYQLRQRLRHAVEICSPTKMLQYWQERQRMVRIFGGLFLQEEATAVENIFNMLKYKQTLLTPYATLPKRRGKKGTGRKNKAKKMPLLSSPEREDIATIAESIAKEDRETGETTPTGEKKIIEDSRDEEEGEETEGESDDIGNDSEELEGEEKEMLEEVSVLHKQMNMHEIYHLMIHNSAQSTESELLQLIDHLSTLDLTASPTKVKQSVKECIEERDFIYLPRFVREPLSRMRLAKSGYELEEAIAEFVKLVPNEFHRKFYLRIYKWTIAFSTWNKPNPSLQVLQQAIAPLESFTTTTARDVGSPGGTLNRSYHLTGTPQMSQPLSPGKTSPSKRKDDRPFSFSQSLRSYTPSTTVSPGKKSTDFRTSMSPQSPSPNKTTIGRTINFSPEATSTIASPQGNGTYIPFSQRQAKSKVAAREILKKGESRFKNVSRAEQSILETVQEYQRFQKKVRHTTFQG